MIQTLGLDPLCNSSRLEDSILNVDLQPEEGIIKPSIQERCFYFFYCFKSYNNVILSYYNIIITLSHIKCHWLLKVLNATVALIIAEYRHWVTQYWLFNLQNLIYIAVLIVDIVIKQICRNPDDLYLMKKPDVRLERKNSLRGHE